MTWQASAAALTVVLPPGSELIDRIEEINDRLHQLLYWRAQRRGRGGPSSHDAEEVAKGLANALGRLDDRVSGFILTGRELAQAKL